jgi:putative transposase
LPKHCMHARFVWSLAVEQHRYWRPGRAGAPGYTAQCRQLTEATKEFAWLAAGSVVVQQQALRDFAQAMVNFFRGTHGRPTWRKAGRHEGFRIVGRRGTSWDVRRLSRKAGEVWVYKIGWIRFRWSRAISDDVKSSRVTRDRAGRWHVAFTAIPPPVKGPGTGGVVGIDRGIVVSAALSTGELLSVPGLRDGEIRRLRRLQRRPARAVPGSNRRRHVKTAIARLKAREVDRPIHAAGWGRLVTRLEQKASGRVEKINPAYTSQTRDVCGHCAAESRESQAVFRCRACGRTDHADVNAAKNIAAGRAVTARGGRPLGRPVNREPQLAPSSP